MELGLKVDEFPGAKASLVSVKEMVKNSLEMRTILSIRKHISETAEKRQTPRVYEI